MSDPLFGPEIRFMLREDDAVGLKSLCEDLHPATVAEALDDGEFTPEQVWDVLKPTSIRTQAAIFEYLPPTRQVEMIEAGRPQAGELIGKMSHDDRVDLLRRLPPKVKETLLRFVDEADRKDMATLFEYGVNTVGALMTTDYAWLPPTMSTAEAIDQLRQQAPDRETIYYVYVLDEAQRRPDGGMAPRRLLGVISLRDLILAPRHAMIRDIMRDELVTLNFQDPGEKAAEILARYDFIALPVTDDKLGMLGIVTHDDVIDVITEEATEDLQRQGAVSPLGESYSDASFGKLWRSRATWLAALFVAELGTFTVMSHFEDALASIVVLALFVPLCISVGGNSGSQASTLITRAMALGEIELSDWKRVIRRELMMGVALGLTLGGIAFFRGAATPADTRGGPVAMRRDFSMHMNGSVPQPDSHGDYVIPVGTEFRTRTDRPQTVRMPENQTGGPKTSVVNGEAVLEFPAGSETRTEPVNRWRLGQVIAFSVMGICIWGTIVGATLPLLFKKINRDPAVASGPFVATFVDITGIAIFFTFAKLLLMD
ncbi:MAG: magnesium transporter [Gemmataceae bacterium]